MSQNDQTHFKNLAANAERFLKSVWPFWDIMHWRVNAFKDMSLKFSIIFILNFHPLINQIKRTKNRNEEKKKNKLKNCINFSQ